MDHEDYFEIVTRMVRASVEAQRKTTYGLDVYDLAFRRGVEANLTDHDIDQLAQHMQHEIESEIGYILSTRMETHEDR